MSYGFVENISGFVRTSIIHRRSSGKLAYLVGDYDFEEKLQRQGMGQHHQFRYRDNFASNNDDIMYCLDILQAPMGSGIGKLHLVLW